jgi:hypothetical protein
MAYYHGVDGRAIVERTHDDEYFLDPSPHKIGLTTHPQRRKLQQCREDTIGVAMFLHFHSCVSTLVAQAWHYGFNWRHFSVSYNPVMAMNKRKNISSAACMLANVG